ncbi:MAG: TIM barrel protein [Candidatus Sericytochromatia bacterium]|nr:TIM barrel protein [Candidatus Sericytochromatia bacterium]
MAPCCFDVASVPHTTTAAEGLEALAHAGWPLALAGERRRAGLTWRASLGGWGERCWLEGRGPGPHRLPPWNLAAAEADVRRHAVREALEVLREAAARGARHHLLPAGWALAGHPGLSEAVSVPRALDQLCRSLDTLAELADARGIGLGVMLEGTGSNASLGTRWDDVLTVLGRVAAPPLGIIVDLDALWQRADHAEADPEAQLRALAPLAHGLRLTAVKEALKAPEGGPLRLLRTLPTPPPPLLLAPATPPGEDLRGVREAIEALAATGDRP